MARLCALYVTPLLRDLRLIGCILVQASWESIALLSVSVAALACVLLRAEVDDFAGLTGLHAGLSVAALLKPHISESHVCGGICKSRFVALRW